MRKINIAVAFILFTVGTAVILGQEGRTFYLVCGTNASLYPDFQRDTIAVSGLTPDQIVFKSVGTTYTAKKIEGASFLAGGDGMTRFVAYRVDDSSFFIATPGIDALSYYHADKRVGDLDDKNKRCAISDLNQFEQLVKIYNQKKENDDKKEQAVFDSQTKGVITDWVKNFSSRRIDPVLAKGINRWWNGPPGTAVVNPILRVVFLEPNYEVTRNEFGVVLRKTVDAMIIFKVKSSGQCHMRWHSFGYESMGGGAFSDEVKPWEKQERIGFDFYPQHILLPGDRKIYAGREYVVDCDAFN